MRASECDAGRRVVLEGLAEAGLAADEVVPDIWATALSGERKRALPVLLRLSERSLHIRALLCGALDEDHAEVYFAGYVEVEQRWREQMGLPPNPLSSS